MDFIHPPPSSSPQYLEILCNFSPVFFLAIHTRQVLDFLEVEKQRGITVKAQTASMFFQNPDPENPGAISLAPLFDFSMFPSRTAIVFDFVLALNRTLCFVFAYVYVFLFRL